jgi:hypothetical protein
MASIIARVWAVLLDVFFSYVIEQHFRYQESSAYPSMIESRYWNPPFPFPPLLGSIKSITYLRCVASIGNI